MANNNQKDERPTLSRREREITDLLFRLGEATAAEVRAQLSEPPSYSAVRALLRILEEKGHILHRSDGTRYIYLPAVKREQAKRSALRHVLDTFFAGSAAGAVAALLDGDAGQLTPQELDRLEARIARAKKETS